jgi:ribosomal-protein-alanine N-acetyltransferase
MGWCGLQYLPETGETEIGYLLGKPFWGKGFATEAAGEALKFGFEKLSLEIIIAIVHPENTASNRVIQKLGYKDPIRATYFGMECLRYTTRNQQQVN